MKKLLLSAFALFLISIATNAQVCGGTFTDPAGSNANYANNSNYTVTICPSNPGEKVTVTFTVFNTEATYDALYVYDGNTTSAPQIPSSNGIGNVPGSIAGGYWGSVIPGPFTSSSPDGCLTFRFRSDASGSAVGWIANVTCSPGPTCPRPSSTNSTLVTSTSAQFNWTENGSANSWETYIVPSGSPAPTNTTNTDVITVNSNQFLFNGLQPITCYTAYIRSVCSETDKSEWSAGYNFCTLVTPPVCGGLFTDAGGVNANYLANSNETTTICPTNIGEMVTVTFTSFNTEANFDALYIFDGNSITAPQIPSSNTAGSVQGGLAGGYWGNTLPPEITASNTSGCLTFNFRSDGGGNLGGWIANISCAPPPSCNRPTNLSLTSLGINSAVLEWANDPAINSWQVLALPANVAVSLSDVGQTVTVNAATFSNLMPHTNYGFYVRSNCPMGDSSGWTKIYARTLLGNDACTDALQIPVNNHTCSQTILGTINTATASNEPLNPPCLGRPDDDVWFKFTATNATHSISLLNIVGTTTNLNFAVYSGSCNSLTSIFCSPANKVSGTLTNLTVGNSYYLRIYTNSAAEQSVTFEICVSIPSSCENSQSICGIVNYPNTTGAINLPAIGCLTDPRNPTYFTVKIATTGPVNLLLTQATIGSNSPNLDVDYAAWGPFTSPAEACSALSSGRAPGIGVPVTQTTGCSFSVGSTENLNITNAQAGQYYVILITNYANTPGYINISQSNANAAGAGSIDCPGIMLTAFLDANENGSKDVGELNFPLGQFHYEINGNGNQHSVIAPSGTYIIYDNAAANIYNLSYSVNDEYNSHYTTAATYSNVNVSAGALNNYSFPVRKVSDYTDLGITIIPESSPRAGTSHNVKIVYTNNGHQIIPTGSLTFTKDAATSITNISQLGAVSTTNGFSYTFSNLLPFESRTITVNISVPGLPTVSIGQLITNTASITSPSQDIVSNNNSNTSTQIVIAAYDPNDKVEGHGEKILISSFMPDDYLEYTIRFENNGTAGALDIMVDDILDAALDPASLVMLSASHNYSLHRLYNNLTWKFNNIQLPVSVPNTNIGKGFIKFKVKPKPGYAVGDVIPNTASIYFDTNPAIITNTFNTIFVNSLGNEMFTENSIILYPNPARSNVYVGLQDSTETIKEILIYDIIGKRVSAVFNVASNQSTIDISNLSKGIYMVEINTDTHLKQIKKLIIQ